MVKDNEQIEGYWIEKREERMEGSKPLFVTAEVLCEKKEDEKMDLLKREVLSILWDKGWTEEEIVKVLRVTLEEVKKYRREQEKWA